MTDRPKRKAIPLSVQVEACLYALGLDPKATDFDHNPALGLRPVNEAGDDYDPPQLDPRYIVPLSRETHAVKTNGDHVPLSGDKSRIAKAARLECKRFDLTKQVETLGADSLLPDWHPSIYAASKPKRAWAKRAFPQGRKFQSRKKVEGA